MLIVDLFLEIMFVCQVHVIFSMMLHLLIVFHSSTGLGYGSVIPDAPGAELHQLTKTLAEKVGRFVEQYVEAMEKVVDAILTNILFFLLLQLVTCFYIRMTSLFEIWHRLN